MVKRAWLWLFGGDCSLEWFFGFDQPEEMMFHRYGIFERMGLWLRRTEDEMQR